MLQQLFPPTHKSAQVHQLSLINDLYIQDTLTVFDVVANSKADAFWATPHIQYSKNSVLFYLIKLTIQENLKLLQPISVN